LENKTISESINSDVNQFVLVSVINTDTKIKLLTRLVAIP